MSLRAWIAFGVLCLAACVAAFMAITRVIDVPAEIKAGSVIKISHEGGHGSAVHVGNGYALTAAHVIPKDATEINVRLDNGDETVADVLVVNRHFDIATLRIKNPEMVASSKLECRTPAIGEAISAIGNPLAMEWITTRGTVAGAMIKAGAWRSVFTMNIAIAGGMSGGPIIDSNGNVVGIIVGVPVQPLGFSGTFVGLGYAVSSRVICDILGRP